MEESRLMKMMVDKLREGMGIGDGKGMVFCGESMT